MDNKARESLCSVPPSKIRALAKRLAKNPPRARSKKDLQLLAEIGACRFSTELYLEAKAKALGKKLVLVCNGRPLPEAPVE